MDFEVRLPGRPVAKIPAWGNLPVELMAAVAGVKPVVHAWVDQNDLARIETLADNLGLKSLVYSRGGAGSGASRVGLMIGADPARLAACAEVWDKPMNNPGEHLGYSACCVKAFWEWNPSFDKKPKDDCIVVALRRTKKSPHKLPWLLNDAYYLYSRPWSQEDVERRESMVRANPEWPLDLLNINAWHPCSYDCADSLTKATKTWAMIETYLPSLAAKLKPALTRPVVFWGWYRFATLEGKADGKGGASYTAIGAPFSLLEPELRAHLASGDRVAPDKDGALSVWKGKKNLGPLPGAPVLLGFSA